MEDEDPSDAKTQLYSDLHWLAPVDSVADLATDGVLEGTLCFVDAEQRVYEFVGGEWITSGGENA
ncbi:MAG: hypothetical protein JRJ84_12285 [Deltaproteobacteria bacterium]|nr:hypothetical protein [Deltaproteobacteria bacterium]